MICYKISIFHHLKNLMLFVFYLFSFKLLFSIKVFFCVNDQVFQILMFLYLLFIVLFYVSFVMQLLTNKKIIILSDSILLKKNNSEINIKYTTIDSIDLSQSVKTALCSVNIPQSLCMKIKYENKMKAITLNKYRDYSHLLCHLRKHKSINYGTVDKLYWKLL